MVCASAAVRLVLPPRLRLADLQGDTMTVLDFLSVARRFVWEPFPPTKWDSVPAVLYRVGTPFQPENPDVPLTAGEREALAKRYIPRLGSARQRYVSAVMMEEPRDLAKPPHERPALVNAIGLSRACTGGLIVERFADLGNRLEQAAVLEVALKLSGLPGIDADVDSVEAVVAATQRELPGTITVGPLRDSAGRRNAALFERNLLAEHGSRLAANIREAVEIDASAVAEASELLAEAVGASAIPEDAEILWKTLAESSMVRDDLRANGARAFVAELRAQGVSDQRVLDALALYGFINDSGHRVWNPGLLKKLSR